MKNFTFIPMFFLLTAAGFAADAPVVVAIDKDGVQRIDIRGGEYSFTTTKPGKYPFYCDKKLLFMDSHREKGMEGILEVVE